MATLVDNKMITEITKRFAALAELVPLHRISTEDEYDEAVNALNTLIDAGGAAEESPLADLVDILGNVIAQYEEVHYPLEESLPAGED